jgi:DNA-binding MarR family transcriptional regulator
MLICAEDGITQTELSKKADMPQATVSRNIRVLSVTFDKEAKELKGYDLVEAKPDLYERRRLACFLTKKGLKLRDKMLQLMNS